MVSIAVLSAVGYIVLFFFKKTADIIHNSKSEENWLYTKFDIARSRTFNIGMYINEVTAIRDFGIALVLEVFYDHP